MKSEAQSIVEEYQATLSELNTSSKVHINALTMLADESKEFSAEIASCIERRLKTCPKNEKLPILHLIDSICKNCPKSIYVQLFTQNLVSNFCKVFEISDESVRRCLHKLRMTWNDSKTFPEKKLNAIDERVHEMDPNWPILHKISPSSHQSSQRARRNVAANVVSSQPQSHAIQPPTTHMALRSGSQQVKTSNIANNPNPINSLKRPNNSGTGQSNGRRKKRGGAANRSNQSNEQPLVAPGPQPFITQNLIQPQHDLTNRVVPTPFLDPSITLGAPMQNDRIHPQAPIATFIDHNLIITNPANGEAHLQTTAPMLCPQPPRATTVPISLPFSQITSTQAPPHQSILDSLYGGKQCSNCSLRFDDNNRYAVHLDWHFRQNLKSDNMFARRKWYYPLNLWVQFREINDDDDLQEANNAEGNTNEILLPTDDDDVPTAPASTDDEKNICSVCHETFEKFWAEEEEEWRLRNAKLYDDERVYHPLCLIDMLQASKTTEVSAAS